MSMRRMTIGAMNKVNMRMKWRYDNEYYREVLAVVSCGPEERKHEMKQGRSADLARYSEDDDRASVRAKGVNAGAKARRLRHGRSSLQYKRYTK